MSMSLHNHSDLEHIEVEFTPEQTEVPVQAAAGRQRAPALEPLPVMRYRAALTLDQVQKQ